LNNFIFFYVDTKTDNLSERHRGIERENIDLFIKSIKKYHNESSIIHCTNMSTETFKDVDIVHREEFDLDHLMVGKVKCFSSLPVNKLSVYLDPDMLLMKTIPIKLFEEKADVFLLKRSFDLSNIMPTTFRKLEFPNHKNKSLENVYPFIACFVILKNQNFWLECLKYFEKLDENYKNWFGDQEIFKKLVEENKYNFAFLEERNFACPPQHLSGKDRPFIVHFKGKYNKELIKNYFKFV
tara:strand:- start:55 stop:771 length:717 start_codon:yes stop_codon:yes gene_type:complete